MLKRIITRLLAHRHPWRKISFGELAELYTSAMLRRAAQSLVGLFIPIYLYQIGYSVAEVLLFLVMSFGLRALCVPLVARLVARYGPKHAMLHSQLVQILALLVLVTLPGQNWPLVLPAFLYGLAGGLYFLAYHVDFSKIMHHEHGGKELGIMQNLQRVATILGPLIGGLIAYFFGAEYTLLAGMVLFAVAAAPLFLSAEPMRTHQQIRFNGLLQKQYLPDYASFFAYNGQAVFALAIWPLFMAVAIFADGVYAKVGLVTSVGMAAALLASYAVGHLVDKQRGRILLNISALANAVLHLFRPLVGGLGGVALVNVAAESVTPGYQIPYLKGLYDRADSLEGQRIAYLTYTEVSSDLGKAVACLAVWALTLVFTPVLALQLGFVLAALGSLAIMDQRFPALKRTVFKSPLPASGN